MQLKEEDNELDLGLTQLLQQKRRRRRALRRFSVRPWILRRGGVSLGTSDASPSFWAAYLSSYVAKIKNAAILIEVLPVTEYWAKMGLLFMARPISYKPRRQLVYCRVGVRTTRRNVVVNPLYLVQNSQTTRALSCLKIS